MKYISKAGSDLRSFHTKAHIPCWYVGDIERGPLVAKQMDALLPDLIIKSSGPIDTGLVDNWGNSIYSVPDKIGFVRKE